MRQKRSLWDLDILTVTHNECPLKPITMYWSPLCILLPHEWEPITLCVYLEWFLPTVGNHLCRNQCPALLSNSHPRPLFFLSLAHGVGPLARHEARGRQNNHPRLVDNDGLMTRGLEPAFVIQKQSFLKKNIATKTSRQRGLSHGSHIILFY